MTNFNECQKVHMASELSLEQCKSVLKDNLKVFFSLDEFKGRLDDNKFWITRSDANNIGVRYSPPKFKGELFQNNNGTEIKGMFDSKMLGNIFDRIAIIWVWIFGVTFFIFGLFDLIFRTKNIQGGSPIIVTVLGPLIIVATSSLIKFFRRLRDKDREAILKMLRDKLNAKDVNE